ncbi:MAG: CpsD/CapB family tyrosine-protein kinase [Candidatus Coatesbacteria bacterium]|nr:CpsD/CapB family tyrosine-protein kinase [Candidatus Coatesbacteria bacterium]
MMKKSTSLDNYMVCVNNISPEADKNAIIEKLARFCKGAARQDIQVAVDNPPFSFRRMNFDSAQSAKQELEKLGCMLDIREGTGVFSAEETVLLESAKRKHSLRLAKGADEAKMFERVKFFASDDVVVESFRTLRTNLLVRMNQGGINSLFLTSASPQEGKSTTATNLGIAMANAGKRTLLVDMDLRNPVLHSFLGIDNSVGLSSIVFDGIEPNMAISHTVFDRLHLLPSGPLLPNPAELLSSSTVRDLLTDLAGQFDVLLADAPPIIGLTDAVVIGTILGDALIVVRADRTSRQQTGVAVQMLENVGCRILGAILNEVDMHKPFYRVYAYSRRM